MKNFSKRIAGSNQEGFSLRDHGGWYSVVYLGQFSAPTEWLGVFSDREHAMRYFQKCRSQYVHQSSVSLP